MTKKILKTIIFLFCCIADLRSLSIGSNITPSRQPLVTFPASGTDNTMLGFAEFEKGFILQSHRTSCTFDDFFPISGKIDLRGGRLFLKKDLTIGSTAFTITSSGSIIGSTLAVEFRTIVTDLALSTSMTFSDVTLIFNNDVRILAPLQFRGKCKISGRGNFLHLKNGGSMTLRPGCNLIFEDAGIDGLQGNNFSCLTDQGSILVRNGILTLARDYTFSRGSILFDEDNMITGTNKFNYVTGLTSTIGSGAILFLDNGITFSYAPRRATSNLIFMTDNTSIMYLNGCTLHSTRTGLSLRTGTLVFDNLVTVSSEAKNSGEALVLNPNLTTNILGNAFVNIFGRVNVS